MEQGGIVKLLLVEDDEDDFILARELVAEIPGKRFTLDWAKTFEAGLNLMVQNQHDVVLADYRLGRRTGWTFCAPPSNGAGRRRSSC